MVSTLLLGDIFLALIPSSGPLVIGVQGHEAATAAQRGAGLLGKGVQRDLSIHRGGVPGMQRWMTPLKHSPYD